jgi:hypothetical protein
MRVFVVVMVAALGCGMVAAGGADETLKFYLDRCKYALAGEVLCEPTKREKPFHWIGDIDKKRPMTVYAVRIKVLDQYQYDGQPYPHKEMTVYVMLPVGAERPDALKKGSKCIFFINWVYGGPNTSDGTSFVTADPWFGVQRHDPQMAELLQKQGKRPPRPGE